jgi:hypothetical protein
MSPAGVPLHVAAAVPQFTTSNLTDALLHNGRSRQTSDGSVNVSRSPVGVPLASNIDELFVSSELPPASGFAGGFFATPGAVPFFAPPGSDASADVAGWVARMNAGNPFIDDEGIDPILHRMLDEFDRRAPLYLTPNASVPIYQIEGFTDEIFPAEQALHIRNHLVSWRSDYPIKSFFGDLGHAVASNEIDVFTAAHSRGQAFLDHYLKESGPEPEFDITAMTTDCLGQARQTFSATSWQGLDASTDSFSSSSITVSSAVPQQLSFAGTTTSGPASAAGVVLDPVVRSEVNGPGCLTVPAVVDTGIAGWNFSVTPFTLLGTPQVAFTANVIGVDAEFNVRIFDVSVDGSTETLVSRGTYRYVSAVINPAPQTITFESSANAWEFQAGHSIRLEIVGNDSPYYQADNLPSVTVISSVSLVLPVAKSPGR